MYTKKLDFSGVDLGLNSLPTLSSFAHFWVSALVFKEERMLPKIMGIVKVTDTGKST